MATAWLTYAWDDNETGDVDFVAQELRLAGITVQLDRLTIGAGKSVWAQIGSSITDPKKCDAWIFYATQKSLTSGPCMEEYDYALNRAIKSRGTFPVVAVLPGTVDKKLLPPGITSRLYVSLKDSDWKERVCAAVDKRAPQIPQSAIHPYAIQVHEGTWAKGSRYAVEVRPRAGTWSPFLAAVPTAEASAVAMRLGVGPKGNVPTMGSALFQLQSGTFSHDAEEWSFFRANNEATPTTSYYLFVNELPKRLIFGQSGNGTYEVGWGGPNKASTDATQAID